MSLTLNLLHIQLSALEDICCQALNDSSRMKLFFKVSKNFNRFLDRSLDSGRITYDQFRSLEKQSDFLSERIELELIKADTNAAESEPSTVTTPVQPEAAATESNSTPGAVRLYPLLAESELCPAGSDDQIKTFPISASIPGDALSMRLQL